MIGYAFVESYKKLCGNNKEALEEFLEIEKQIDVLDKKRKRLIDMRLEEIIDKE